MIAGIEMTPLKHIRGDAGDIFHIMRSDAAGFKGFGEVYISTVKPGNRKGWKRHTKMTLNLVVPFGKIRFVLYEQQTGIFQEVVLSPEDYHRLTVPPGIWMAFQNEGTEESFLINFASIPHDPTEAETLQLDNTVIPYAWS
ncbi:MAG: WxcM-like domain-containing protein [Chitinophagaceae bacterium]|nr:WxcM-like domain-containing protein [Chitinophagaceae bacterium]